MSLLSTRTSIDSGGVMIVLWNQTYTLSKITIVLRTQTSRGLNEVTINLYLFAIAYTGALCVFNLNINIAKIGINYDIL